MKNIALIVILLAFTFTAHTQSVRSRRMVFDGTIGKAAITAVLEISNAPETSVSGEYLYNKNTKNERISISNGKIMDSYVIMCESYFDKKKNNYEFTGYFSGKMENWAISGIWTDPGFTKVYPFTLKPRAQYLHRDLSFNANFANITVDDNYDNNVDYGKYFLHLTKINITDEAGNIKQTIRFNDVYVDKDKNPMRLEDLNFDGYLDLVVEERYPGVAKGDWGQIYYLYNPKSDSFDYNEELNALGILDVDPIKNTLTATTADGRGNETYDTYVYDSGKYLIIRHEALHEDSDKLYYIDYKIVNGQSVEQKRNYPKD